jgi:hypothetical protein
VHTEFWWEDLLDDEGDAGWNSGWIVGSLVVGMGEELKWLWIVVCDGLCSLTVNRVSYLINEHEAQ